MSELDAITAALLALYMEGYRAGIEHAAEHEAVRYGQMIDGREAMLAEGRTVALEILDSGEWPEFEAARRLVTGGPA